MSDINNDQQSRDKALNPRQSYLVQAPAGSGKTELLSQRVLKLLANVQKPEEIVALTFTKKAASEMRARIIESLQNAYNNVQPQEHKVITNNLALKVLEADKKYQWNLLFNPSRLNITTIDSLCAKLVKQTPLLSKIGGDLEITDEPVSYYQQAVKQLFDLINTDSYDTSCDWTHNLKVLLQHFSCNYAKLQSFLLSMLYKREQWLPYVVSTGDDNMHQLMLSCWQELTSDVINTIQQSLGLSIIAELDDVLAFARENIIELFDEQELNAAQASIVNFENSQSDYWQAIAYLLFTTSVKLDFRKKLDKRLGFPSKTSFKLQEEKQRSIFFKDKLLAIISDIKSHGPKVNEQLINSFSLLRTLPAFDYSEDNWHTLKVLSRVLLLLEAQLRLVFSENKLTDFSGISQAALYSLGDVDNPSDLNLYFDYSIKHLLVDEFQDTSYTQFKLLERLTSTWEQEDQQHPRTLFLVGDPQQSIYRFRQAEVGLFLQVKKYGLGKVKTEFLSLRRNFRSEQQIVDWVNDKFSKIFPRSSDILFGAVSYEYSIATKKLSADNQPSLNIFTKDTDSLNENSFIINSIKNIIKNQDQERTSIAILVRNRSKVLELITELKNNDIAINAVDIELLTDKMVIKDLLSLTKAIVDLSDRVAWYSVLRAPWCGMTLTDLYQLHIGNEDKTLWQCLQLADNSKLNNIKAVFEQVFSKLFKINFYKLVEQAWYGLGGHLIYSNNQDICAARQYFDLLFSLEDNNFIDDTESLTREVAKLYANNDVFVHQLSSAVDQADHSGSYTIDIMTIHKSKGLQFDHVFVPYMDATTRVDSHQMLAWQQYHNENINGILLAPYHIKENEQVKFYQSLRFIETLKDSYELARLFYVAVTRAIKACHLSASLSEDKLELISGALSEGSQCYAKAKINSKSLLGLVLPYQDPTNIVVNLNAKSDDNNNIVSHKKLYNIKPDSFDARKIISYYNSNDRGTQDNQDCQNEYTAIILPDDLQAVASSTKDLFDNDAITGNPTEYLLADNTYKIIGTFVHKIFYNISMGYFLPSLILDNTSMVNKNLLDRYKGILLQAGIALNKINHALDIISNALVKILSDDFGLWLLNNNCQSYAEKEIQYTSRSGKLQKSIIDRLIITDKEIWIVDYKVSEYLEDNHSGIYEADESIINQYKKQLEHYTKLVLRLYQDIIVQNNLTIKTGLYFVLSDQPWHQLDIKLESESKVFSV